MLGTDHQVRVHASQTDHSSGCFSCTQLGELLTSTLVSNVANESQTNISMKIGLAQLASHDTYICIQFLNALAENNY